MREQAPILRDATRRHLWVHEKFERDTRPAPQHVCRLTLQLVDDLLRALTVGDPRQVLWQVDDTLVRLRYHLRLVREKGDLEEGGLLHALRLADDVGRQLGGWLRSLDAIA